MIPQPHHFINPLYDYFKPWHCFLISLLRSNPHFQAFLPPSQKFLQSFWTQCVLSPTSLWTSLSLFLIRVLWVCSSSDSFLDPMLFLFHTGVIQDVTLLILVPSYLFIFFLLFWNRCWKSLLPSWLWWTSHDHGDSTFMVWQRIQLPWPPTARWASPIPFDSNISRILELLKVTALDFYYLYNHNDQHPIST